MAPAPPPVALLDTLIEAPHAFDGWNQALSRLQAYIPSTSISVIIRSCSENEDAFVRRFGPPFDASLERAYAEHWHRYDPVASLVSRSKPGTIVTSNRLLPTRELLKTPVYMEWALPGGIADAMVSKISEIEGRSYWIGIDRDRRMESFDDEDAEKLRQVFPYLRNALVVEGHLEEQRSHSKMVGQMLESFDEATFVIDARGQLLMLNRRARELLAGGCLSLAGDSLGTTDEGETRALQEWLAAPISADSNACRVLRPTELGVPALRLMKMPLPRASSSVPASLLFARPLSGHGAVLTERDLAEVLGLSPVEASIVHGIARTESLEVIAGRLQITVGTVRNHLKRIFTKLGISRQAELVALTHSLTPSVRTGGSSE